MEWSEERYDEFVKLLEEKHPKMFSYPYGGVCVGEGWWDIIRLLSAQIDSYIKWKRNTRAYDLRYNRALERGYPAMLKFVMKGKDPSMANTWQLEQAEQNASGEPRRVTERVEYVTVHQIKEKFGGLRFYVHGATDKHYNYISFAESMSYRTCEECGAPGKRYTDGWHRTLCDIHAEMDGRSEEYVNDGDE